MHGPLKLFREILEETSSSIFLLEYMSQVCERLPRVSEIAKKNLTSAKIYDTLSAYRSFQPGDSVLVLLPIPSSPLQAMAKPYVKKAYVNTETVPVPVVSSVTCEDDNLGVSEETTSCTPLSNSELFLNIESHLNYLSEGHRKNIVSLIHEFPSLFSDNLSQTNVLFHDIDVMNAAPIEQHPYRVNPLKRNMMRKEVNSYWSRDM